MGRVSAVTALAIEPSTAELVEEMGDTQAHAARAQGPACSLMPQGHVSAAMERAWSMEPYAEIAGAQDSTEPNKRSHAGNAAGLANSALHATAAVVAARWVLPVANVAGLAGTSSRGRRGEHRWLCFSHLWQD